MMMKTLTACIATFSSALAIAGGGSSVGGGDVHTSLSTKLIRTQGNMILDASTGESLLQVTPLDPSTLPQQTAVMVKSKLGLVDGFEYLPTIGSKTDEHWNYWIACPKVGNCLLFRPLSHTNAKVLSVIGSLYESP